MRTRLATVVIFLFMALAAASCERRDCMMLSREAVFLQSIITKLNYVTLPSEIEVCKAGEYQMVRWKSAAGESVGLKRGDEFLYLQSPQLATMFYDGLDAVNVSRSPDGHLDLSYDTRAGLVMDTGLDGRPDSMLVLKNKPGTYVWLLDDWRELIKRDGTTGVQINGAFAPVEQRNGAWELLK